MQGYDLAAALKRHQRTQRWLADQLGVTSGAVSHWVKGRAPIPEVRLEQIEALLRSEAVGEAQLEDLTWLHAVHTPMSFLLRTPAHMIEGLTPQGKGAEWELGTHEQLEFTVRAWARYLELPVTHLLAVARRERTITEAELAKVYAIGVGLTWLGEHLGGQQTLGVNEWLDVLGPWDSFAHLELALAQRQDIPLPLEADEGRQRAVVMWPGHQPTAWDQTYERWKEMST